MTPKQKAIELIEKFECLVDYQGDDCFTEREKMLINAKQCALIAVDEILNYIGEEDTIYPSPQFEFWKEVKEEINKL